MSSCEKCGYEYELGYEAHDCVKVLLEAIEILKAENERLEREVEEWRDSADNNYRRAYEAEQVANRARAEARSAEERNAYERAAERRKRQQEEEDRRWATLTRRRW